MSRPTRKTARIARWAAVPVALALSGLAVAQASYSAYSDTTVNPTSSWASGTVDLEDDDAGTALFNASNIKPGATGTKCIAVTSTGSPPSAVKLYGTSAATTKSLASSIQLTITQGTGGSTAGCSGFTPLSSGASLYSGTLAGFASASTGYGNGVGSWAPTGTASETRVYRFAYTLDANAPDSTQGGTASLGFTWEAQNS